MLWKGFQRPKRIDFDKESVTPTFARFTAQPFERGFATTIGNALRRSLLSSIEGAAVTAIHIEGVLHEFSSIPGVVEDVTDIILNLRDVPISVDSDEPRILNLDMKGPGVATAGDLVGDSSIEVLRSGSADRDAQRRRSPQDADAGEARSRLCDC